jgi:hypothetical protein
MLLDSAGVSGNSWACRVFVSAAGISSAHALPDFSRCVPIRSEASVPRRSNTAASRAIRSPSLCWN